MRSGDVNLTAGCLTTARGRLFFCTRAAQAALSRREAMYGPRVKTNSQVQTRTEIVNAYAKHIQIKYHTFPSSDPLS